MSPATSFIAQPKAPALGGSEAGAFGWAVNDRKCFSNSSKKTSYAKRTRIIAIHIAFHPNAP
jgi:hypothetical protein